MFSPDFEFANWLEFGLVLIFYVVSLLHVIHAVMHVRTSQGTIAWVISLITVPFLSLPLYWLLGRSRFTRIVGGRREKNSQLNHLAAEMHVSLRNFKVELADDNAFERAAELLGGLPFTRGNDC